MISNQDRAWIDWAWVQYKTWPRKIVNLTKVMDVTKYPIVEKAYNLGLAIESLPASEAQTALSVKCSELARGLYDLLEKQTETEKQT